MADITITRQELIQAECDELKAIVSSKERDDPRRAELMSEGAVATGLAFEPIMMLLEQAKDHPEAALGAMVFGAQMSMWFCAGIRLGKLLASTPETTDPTT